MVKAMLPLKHRDYCAHYYISYRKCKRDAGKFDFSACNHEKHEWEHCQYDDFVMRMKEYERERRLQSREARVGALSVRRLRHEDEGIRA